MDPRRLPSKPLDVAFKKATRRMASRHISKVLFVHALGDSVSLQSCQDALLVALNGDCACAIWYCTSSSTSLMFSRVVMLPVAFFAVGVSLYATLCEIESVKARSELMIKGIVLRDRCFHCQTNCSTDLGGLFYIDDSESDIGCRIDHSQTPRYISWRWVWERHGKS